MSTSRIETPLPDTRPTLADMVWVRRILWQTGITADLLQGEIFEKARLSDLCSSLRCAESRKLSREDFCSLIGITAEKASVSAKYPRPTPDQMTKVYQTLVQAGVTSEVLRHELIARDRLLDLCRSARAGALQGVPRNQFRLAIGLSLVLWEPLDILVYYNLNFASMVRTGAYQWISQSVTPELFPFKTGGEVVPMEAMLANFAHGSTTSQIRHALTDFNVRTADTRMNQWRFADFEELLALGAEYPREQRLASVVALETVGQVDGLRCVPCVQPQGYLNAVVETGTWSGATCFLVVRPIRKK